MKQESGYMVVCVGRGEGGGAGEEGSEFFCRRTGKKGCQHIQRTVILLFTIAWLLLFLDFNIFRRGAVTTLLAAIAALVAVLVTSVL